MQPCRQQEKNKVKVGKSEKYGLVRGLHNSREHSFREYKRENDKIGQVEGAEGDRSGCFTAVIYLSVSA